MDSFQNHRETILCANVFIMITVMINVMIMIKAMIKVMIMIRGGSRAWGRDPRP